MSDLTERLRNVTYMDDAEYLCAQAADALEAAEAELARLEHQLQQAEEVATTAYKDAETAEAKLAAIDALLWDYMRSTTLIMEGHPSEGRHDAYMTVWHILHPEEDQ